MQQSWKTIIALVITAIVVGGGVYYWQQNKISPMSSTPQSSTIEVKTKTIDDYINTYEKSPITLADNQLNQLVKVFSLGREKCSPESDEMDYCTPEVFKNNPYISGVSLLSDAEWSDGKDHEFYFEFGIEGPPLHYGPFRDDVLRLKQEASQKENYIK